MLFNYTLTHKKLKLCILDHYNSCNSMTFSNCVRVVALLLPKGLKNIDLHSKNSVIYYMFICTVTVRINRYFQQFELKCFTYLKLLSNYSVLKIMYN